jgi:hypothetical protein
MAVICIRQNRASDLQRPKNCSAVTGVAAGAATADPAVAKNTVASLAVVFMPQNNPSPFSCEE